MWTIYNTIQWRDTDYICLSLQLGSSDSPRYRGNLAIFLIGSWVCVPCYSALVWLVILCSGFYYPGSSCSRVQEGVCGWMCIVACVSSQVSKINKMTKIKTKKCQPAARDIPYQSLPNSKGAATSMVVSPEVVGGLVPEYVPDSGLTCPKI